VRAERAAPFRAFVAARKAAIRVEESARSEARMAGAAVLLRRAGLRPAPPPEPSSVVEETVSRGHALLMRAGIAEPLPEPPRAPKRAAPAKPRSLIAAT
jgi:hypothetical protein